MTFRSNPGQEHHFFPIGNQSTYIVPTRRSSRYRDDVGDKIFPSLASSLRFYTLPAPLSLSPSLQRWSQLMTLFSVVTNSPSHSLLPDPRDYTLGSHSWITPAETSLLCLRAHLWGSQNKEWSFWSPHYQSSLKQVVSEHPLYLTWEKTLFASMEATSLNPTEISSEKQFPSFQKALLTLWLLHLPPDSTLEKSVACFMPMLFQESGVSHSAWTILSTFPVSTSLVYQHVPRPFKLSSSDDDSKLICSLPFWSTHISSYRWIYSVQSLWDFPLKSHWVCGLWGL